MSTSTKDAGRAVAEALIGEGWTTHPESTGFRLMQMVNVYTVAQKAVDAAVESGHLVPAEKVVVTSDADGRLECSVLMRERNAATNALDELDNLLGSFRRLIDGGGTVSKELVALARQIAQAGQPSRVSVDDVVGIFDGPDSVDWLRGQRG